jgi:glycosyltransferase involved in cell wall biosynthesis
VDDVVLVDDASRDDTAEVARRLGIKTIVHERNKGYGGNQKTRYRTALDLGADIAIMLHPDCQYTPRLITAMGSVIAYGEFDQCSRRGSSARGRSRAGCRCISTSPTAS